MIISFIVPLLVCIPCNSRALNKLVDTFSDIFKFHPYYLVNLLMIDLYSLNLAYASSHKEICLTSVCLKLYPDLWINLIANWNSCLFKYLSCRTVLRFLVLVPFSFGKAEPILYFDCKDFSVIFVENESSTDRLILLQFNKQKLGIDFQARRSELF